MLLAFYPVVSAAAFVQARAERPEYFAGGVIFGSKGDKLRLPDGREWDCIVAAGGPPSGRRWSCSFIDPSVIGEIDPFPLEAGPLVPLDEQATTGPLIEWDLEQRWGGEMGALDGTDGVLAAAATTAAEFTGAADLENSYAREIDPAADAHATIRSALDGDDPADELGAIDDHSNIIAATTPDYEEPPPPDIAEPDPGNPPPSKGGDGDPPPPSF